MLINGLQVAVRSAVLLAKGAQAAATVVIVVNGLLIWFDNRRKSRLRSSLSGRSSVD